MWIFPSPKMPEVAAASPARLACMSRANAEAGPRSVTFGFAVMFMAKRDAVLARQQKNLHRRRGDLHAKNLAAKFAEFLPRVRIPIRERVGGALQRGKQNGVHQYAQPMCSATMPPLRLCTRTSSKPARSIISFIASWSGVFAKDSTR